MDGAAGSWVTTLQGLHKKEEELEYCYRTLDKAAQANDEGECATKGVMIEGMETAAAAAAAAAATAWRERRGGVRGWGFARLFRGGGVDISIGDAMAIRMI